MSAPQQRERFVIYASNAALEQAQRFGLSGVLENVVRDAILDHGKRRLGENEHVVRLDDELVARTVTLGKTASGKRRVLVRRLERAPGPTNSARQEARRGDASEGRR